MKKKNKTKNTADVKTEQNEVLADREVPDICTSSSSNTSSNPDSSIKIVMDETRYHTKKKKKRLMALIVKFSPLPQKLTVNTKTNSRIMVVYDEMRCANPNCIELIGSFS